MRSARKIRLRRAVACLVAAAVVTAPWWLLGYGSPVAQGVYRFAVSSSMRKTPGFTLKIERMGVLSGLRAFRADGIRYTAGGAWDVRVNSVVVRYSLLPLVTGRLAIRNLVIDGVRIAADFTEPVPDTVKSGDTGNGGGFMLETAPLKLALLTNASATARMQTATNAPVCVLLLTNFVFSLGQRAGCDPVLPFTFAGATDYRIDAGTNARITTAGRCNLDAHSQTNFNMDWDLTAKQIPLPDLNPLFAGASPFLVRSGVMDYYLNLNCRSGKLTGITSLKTRNLTLLHNAGSIGTGFLRLSFDAWRFLAQQRNGAVEADCNIGGMIGKPVLPIGAVLREQAVGAGRNMGIRLVEKIPTSFTKNLAAKWEDGDADRDRYDNILKISRLDPSEQHFERGRHFKEIARNYNRAVEEFMLQVSTCPEGTNMAVRAMLSAADIERTQMRDLPEAIRVLRMVPEKYPGHADADDAMLTMIQLTVELKRYPDANILCNEFREKFIHSELAPRVAEIQKSIADLVW